MSGSVVVATVECRLHFWDVRAGSRPAIVVHAHTQRIHALDAGSTSSEQYQVVTAADGDARMALWDVRNLDKPFSQIESPFLGQPPRRIRFSPQGGMILVTASSMPAPSTSDEPRAAVISFADSAVYMLPGHTDHVYDAIWSSGDTVLSWSHDFNIRLFQITTRSVSDISPSTVEGLSRDVTPSTPPMARQFPTSDSSHIQASSDSITSSSIPSSVPPIPVISPQPNNPTVPLPPPLPATTIAAANVNGPMKSSVDFAIPPADYFVPSPRTAGARFCSAGFLVSLHRLYTLKKGNDRALADFHRSMPSSHAAGVGRQRSHRPRHTSLSRNDGVGGNPVSSGGTLTLGVLVGAVSPGSVAGHHHHHYHHSGSSSALGTSGSSGSDSRSDNRQHSVLIYSVNSLLMCNREMAAECRLDWTQPAECCRYNAEIASSFNRPDLAQAFSVAALVLKSSTFMAKPDLVTMIGQNALVRMFSHYVKQGCQQDAAMLAFFLACTGIDLNISEEHSIPASRIEHAVSYSPQGGDGSSADRVCSHYLNLTYKFPHCM